MYVEHFDLGIVIQLIVVDVDMFKSNNDDNEIKRLFYQCQKRQHRFLEPFFFLFCMRQYGNKHVNNLHIAQIINF